MLSLALILSLTGRKDQDTSSEEVSLKEKWLLWLHACGLARIQL